MLTRKHFKELVEFVKRMDGDNVSKQQVVNMLVEFLSRQNSRFDANKFREACGVE